MISLALTKKEGKKMGRPLLILHITDLRRVLRGTLLAIALLGIATLLRVAALLRRALVVVVLSRHVVIDGSQR